LQVKYNRIIKKIPPVRKSCENVEYKIPIHQLRKNAVKHFLEEDENSKMCPGKKDTVTKNKKKKTKKISL